MSLVKLLSYEDLIRKVSLLNMTQCIAILKFSNDRRVINYQGKYVKDLFVQHYIKFEIKAWRDACTCVGNMRTEEIDEVLDLLSAINY